LSRTFQPSPIVFRELSATLPAGVTLSVPDAFRLELALGDPLAGARIWRYSDGQVSLWWAPGPSEPLVLDTALVMLEATFESEHAPRVLDVEEGEWDGQRAFRFTEGWPDSAGGAAEAWVIQGPAHWLYVLRVRPVGAREAPPLVREVRDTFAFVPE